VAKTVEGIDAFNGCWNLTSIRLPSNVTSIGDSAFFDCSSLEKAVFLGNAPWFFGSSVFVNPALGFTVQFLNGASWFTLPTWYGYSSEELNLSSSWLVKNGFAEDMDLRSDLNGDGVSLLMAYALNLDPHKDLQNTMPIAKAEAGSLSMKFYGANEDVDYIVEGSEDMKTWTSKDVFLSEPDENGNRIATVSRKKSNGEDVSSLFLRLRVKQK